MGTSVYIRLGLGLVMLGLLASARPDACSGQEYPKDPVEELRLALRLEDVRLPNEFQLEFRRKNLDEKIKALKTMGDLRRALGLDEWKEEKDQGRNEALRLIDVQKRKVVGDRLKEAIRSVIATGTPSSRLALANMLAEMGATVRALEVMDKGGFARHLTPEVIQLTQNADLAVREQALRALGNINPEPDKAIAVFQKVLTADIPQVRLLAAQGLTQMLRVTSQLRKRSQSTTRIEATEMDVLKLIVEVVPVARIGLRDPDPGVQATCLDAVQTAANALTDLIYEPFSRKNFPPPGRRLSEEEAKDVLATYDMVRNGGPNVLGLHDLQPAFKMLQANTPAIIPNLAAANASVRLAAINALEAVAWARLKEKRRRESVPLPSTFLGKVPALTMDDPLALFLDKGMFATANLLRDPQVRIRRRALDFLETIGDSAIPAIPAVIDSLKDSDKFARWAAARTLAGLPPDKIQGGVPALVALLRDPDLNVRQTAAGTLESMGNFASSAALALAQDLLSGDVEERTMLMAVLTRLPADQAKVAVPQLAVLLTDGDPRLRKAAAETLGKLGSQAQSALPALRRLLGDDDTDVRAAASDAMLSISARVK